MNCPKCNSQMPDGTIFCSSCGSSMVSSYASNDVSFSSAAPNGTKNGPDKKKIFIFAAIGVVVLALIIGLIAFIAVNSTPEAKVMNAANKSMKQFEKLLKSSDNFVEMTDNAENLLSKETFTVTADIVNDDAYVDNADINVTFSKGKNEMGASGTIKVEEIAFDFQLYVNEKAASVQIDDMDSAYTVPFDKFGEKFAQSDLYEMLEDVVDDEVLEMLENLDPDFFTEPTWKGFKKAYPEEAKAFEKVFELKKTKESIPETSGKMTVYALELDMEAYIDMAVAYSCYTSTLSIGEAAFENAEDYMDEIRDSYDYLEDLEGTIYFGISNGCLKAIHAELDMDGNDVEITFVLEGTKNIWDEAVLYIDGDEYLTLTVEDTGNGFEITIESEVSDNEITIECDDSANEIILSVDGEEMFVIEFSADNKGCQLSFEYEDYSTTTEVKISLLPLQKIEPIKSAQNIFEMSEDDIEDAIEELYEIFE